MHSKLHIKMFPKIVPPACRSIIFFPKDRPKCVSGILLPLADEVVALSVLGASLAWGFLPNEGRDYRGLPRSAVDSCSEDCLRYLGSSSSLSKR